MENLLRLSAINDFLFCPASIFYHGMYEGLEKLIYQETSQINGAYAHKNIDDGTPYDKNILSGLPVYSSTYNLTGKIDRYYINERKLVESKKFIGHIYDGYVLQLYGQYFAMVDMGYIVKKIALYSIDTNKTYPVKLPFDDKEMFHRFEEVLSNMQSFSMNNFFPDNVDKCNNCIYSHICAWG